MKLETANYESKRQECSALLGIEIPAGITIPEPMPENEYQWYGWIEFLGGAQWRINHDLADKRPWLPSDSGLAGLRDVTDNLVFWAEQVVAPRFNLVLPKDCPPGNKGNLAGAELSESTRSIIKSITGVEVPAVIPYPSEGKQWWWDWYHLWKPTNDAGDLIHNLSWQIERSLEKKNIGRDDAYKQSREWSEEKLKFFDSQINRLARRDIHGVLHSHACVQRAVEEFTTQIKWDVEWPDSCKACSACGVMLSPGDAVPYGSTMVRLPDDVEPCFVCSGNDLCPRCGEPGTINEANGDDTTNEGLCLVCGWSYDLQDTHRPYISVLDGPCDCALAWEQAQPPYIPDMDIGNDPTDPTCEE